MSDTRRWLGVVTIGLMLGIPGSARAQSDLLSSPDSARSLSDLLSGAPPDRPPWSLQETLFGTWIHRRADTVDGKPTEREFILFLRPDSTWKILVRRNGVELPRQWVWELSEKAWADRRWYLTGDSLWLSDPAVDKDGYQRVAFFHGHPHFGKVTGSLTGRGFACHAMEFEAADSFALKTSVRNPRPVHLKQAELVGTWVAKRGITLLQLDTLTLRPDSTWSRVKTQVMDGVMQFRQRFEGNWDLDPDRNLRLMEKLGEEAAWQVRRVDRESLELASCSMERLEREFTRATP